jgi:hypothetical protein
VTESRRLRADSTRQTLRKSMRAVQWYCPAWSTRIAIVSGECSRMHEPLGSVVFQATTRDVGTVLIAGKIMKQAGKLNGVDSDRLAAQAENSAREIFERVRKSGATLPTVPH